MKKSIIYLTLGLFALSFGCSCPCNNATAKEKPSAAGTTKNAKTTKELITGADQVEKYVPYLKGKRVALFVNQSSIIDGKPSVDRLLAMGVKIVKIFGPEHGFRGNASAGAVVADEIDPQTGIPIVSLYGKKNKPTKADMADVDIVIYDMQDVGVRFYTNINAMRNMMEVCAEYGVELMILDRPNPHGYLVDGPILDMKHKSGIGQFPIPIAHGMTVGEFALMVKGEKWMTHPEKCKLQIIKIANYQHDMPYVLPVNPSPNLNTPQSVMLYPSTCLFEGTILNHGRGTYFPFTVLGAPALKGKYEFSYTPVGIKGMAETPLHMNEVCYGLDLRNYNVEELRKKRQINLTWMMELYKAYPDKKRFFDSSYSKEIGTIETRVGTSEFRKQIMDGVSEAEIRKSWEPGLIAFRALREKYLLYP